MPSVEMPSGLTEGIPVAVMEAMAAGVPVVASAVSGMHELVMDGHTGLLVPPGDDRALAAAIARLIDDPDLAPGLGERAWQHVADHFDIHRTTAQLADHFTAALTSR
jgi:glycosyltransferase involved in cell wall biosynthesis